MFSLKSFHMRPTIIFTENCIGEQIPIGKIKKNKSYENKNKKMSYSSQKTGVLT